MAADVAIAVPPVIPASPVLMVDVAPGDSPDDVFGKVINNALFGAVFTREPKKVQPAHVR